MPDSTFTSAEVSNYAAIQSWSTSQALEDLQLNSDLSPSDTSDAAKRNRNKAKAILVVQAQIQ